MEECQMNYRRACRIRTTLWVKLTRFGWGYSTKMVMAAVRLEITAIQLGPTQRKNFGYYTVKYTTYLTLRNAWCIRYIQR